MFARTIAVLGCCAALGAVAAAAPTEAASGHRPAQAGRYEGRTGQHRVIAFELRHGGLLDLRHFSIELRCRDGSTLIEQESGFEPSRLTAAGTFREDQVGSTDEVWLRGRARGRLLQGRIRVKDRWGHVRCDSRWVRFTAKRR